jgi:hypothetical protein
MSRITYGVPRAITRDRFMVLDRDQLEAERAEQRAQ